MNQHAAGDGHSRLASSVEDFCRDHGISRTHLYQLWKDGKGPRRMALGRRTLVSQEAAAEWRARMEAETAAAGVL
jgi:predicted DNA-binding transcriptional regulator AlpA